jgi:hypothetical protein
MAKGEHDDRKKKPEPMYIDPGISLFHPQDHRDYLSTTQVASSCSGRSSDSPSLLPAFPSFVNQLIR